MTEAELKLTQREERLIKLLRTIEFGKVTITKENGQIMVHPKVETTAEI
jgi:hypothetical protein